ncbi:hypothetical protein LguiA_003524 [Lonicera macranthoides]
MGSEEHHHHNNNNNRFPMQQQQPPAPRHKRWGKCWGGLSCFGTQKGGKRVVPASRMPEANALVNQPNGSQAVVGLGNHHQATTIAPSLLAPPSSPASFSNSALPSTAQSPNCFLSLSANSPGGPSSSMYATGPYAHETQLVSPPVFSTFTTEPSTAPFTPPPELAHVTTPSSPDVPFAQFLSSSSSRDLKSSSTGKRNYIPTGDLQATYSLYPGSPASGSLISPVSRASGDCLSSSFPEREFDPQANFFCPETFAQFYLDNSSFPHSGGRLSVSKESDVYGNGHQNNNRQNKTSSKQDVEELEAYRASFGFSADEIITTAQYVEISDVSEESFTMRPFASSNKGFVEEAITMTASLTEKAGKVVDTSLPSPRNCNKSNISEVACCQAPGSSCNGFEEEQGGKGRILSDEEDRLSKMMGTCSTRKSRKSGLGLSSSDAEIEYGSRRGRNPRQGKGDFAWHD